MSKRLKVRWSEEDDDVLRKAVNKYPFTKGATAVDWKDVASITGRSTKQCRERWINVLDPRIKRTPWTEAEVQRLFELHGQIGNKWSVISSRLDGRPETAVKNIFYSAVRREKRREHARANGLNVPPPVFPLEIVARVAKTVDCAPSRSMGNRSRQSASKRKPKKPSPIVAPASDDSSDSEAVATPVHTTRPQRPVTRRSALTVVNPETPTRRRRISAGEIVVSPVVAPELPPQPVVELALPCPPVPPKGGHWPADLLHVFEDERPVHDSPEPDVGSASTLHTPLAHLDRAQAASPFSFDMLLPPTAEDAVTDTSYPLFTPGLVRATATMPVGMPLVMYTDSMFSQAPLSTAALGDITDFSSLW